MAALLLLAAISATTAVDRDLKRAMRSPPVRDSWVSDTLDPASAIRIRGQSLIVGRSAWITATVVTGLLALHFTADDGPDLARRLGVRHWPSLVALADALFEMVDAPARFFERLAVLPLPMLAAFNTLIVAHSVRPPSRFVLVLAGVVCGTAVTIQLSGQADARMQQIASDTVLTGAVLGLAHWAIVERRRPLAFGRLLIVACLLSRGWIMTLVVQAAVVYRFQFWHR